jgi:TPR repeat protein
MKRMVSFVLLWGLLISGASTAVHAGDGRRIALVIGNGDYRNVPALPNPSRDARAISQSLEGLGFQVITAFNLATSDMTGVIRNFARQSRSADIALFYYAGHAVQVDGRNYLLPIGSDIQVPRDLTYEAVSLDLVTEELEANDPDLSMILLDACRDDPLSERFQAQAGRLGRSIETGSGLAQTKGAAGMLIAYATAPDQVALDGEGEHSPFTQALLEWIDQPGIEVGRVFRRVRERVIDLTGGAQVPWVEEAVIGEFYLNGSSRPTADNLNPETLFWQSVQDIDDPSERLAALQRYLVVFPSGNHIEDAKRLRRALMARLADDRQQASGDLFGAQKLVLQEQQTNTDVAALSQQGEDLRSRPRSESGGDPLALCENVAGDPLSRTFGEGRWVNDRHYPPSPGFQRLDPDIAIDVCLHAMKEAEAKTSIEALIGRAMLASGRTAEALRYLHPAADAGDPVAQYNLGQMFKNGLRGAPDLVAAQELFKKAADQGHVGAAFELGLLHRDGLIGRADNVMAIAWLRRSAGSGYEWAQYEIGRHYYDNPPEPGDRNQAATFWRYAAAQGNAKAAFALGMMLKDGDGVPVDTQAAGNWLRLAMVQGVREAERPLAETLLITGNGVEAGTEALQLLEQAASRQDSDAALLLGRLYAGGQSGVADPVVAAYWLAKAHQNQRTAQQAATAFAGLPAPAVIEAIQRALSTAGHDPGAFSGSLSQETLRAIDSFRQDNGLAASDDVSIGLLGQLIQRNQG